MIRVLFAAFSKNGQNPDYFSGSVRFLLKAATCSRSALMPGATAILGGYNLYGEVVYRSEDSQCIAVSAAELNACVDDRNARIRSSVNSQPVYARNDVKVSCIIHVVQIRHDEASV